MADLLKRLDRISAPDVSAGVDAQRWLDQLTKPPGSLGRLEELARRLAEITGRCPPAVEHPVIFTLAGDHGVVEEGVSAYPQVVTAQMVENFIRGGAAVNVLARHAGARVVVADFGVAAPLAEQAVGRIYAQVDEMKLIDTFIRRKIHTKEPLAEALSDPKKLASAYRKLIRAGFTSGNVIRALKRIASRQDLLDSFEPPEQTEGE